MRFKDLTGKRFERLVVIKRVEDDLSKNRQWLCKCDCGTVKVVGGRHLTSGKTKSCGCFAREKKNNPNFSHGMSDERIYGIWTGIKYRCRNHPDYVSREITMCTAWDEDFEKFYEWAMDNGYDDNLSIDRINNDGNYEPDNCRWADAKTQANNRRSSRKIHYKGETLSLAEQCRKHKLNYNTVSTRLLRGWPVERAMKLWTEKNKPGMQDIPMRDKS